MNTGPLFAGTIANDSSVGSVDWSDISFGGADDTSYAAAASMSSVDTRYLKFTNFNPNIPTGSTINSVAVAAGRFQTGVNGVTDVADFSVRLVRAGTIGGTDKANTVDGGWPQFNFGSWSPISYSANLWGLTWTVSQVNDSTTGVVIAASITSDGVEEATAWIDYVTMDWDYTPPVAAGNKNFFAFFRDRMKFEWPFSPQPRRILALS